MYACIIISPLGIRAHVACFLTCTHVSLCLISLRWWLRPRGRRWLVLQSDLTVPLPPSPVEQVSYSHDGHTKCRHSLALAVTHNALCMCTHGYSRHSERQKNSNIEQHKSRGSFFSKSCTQVGFEPTTSRLLGTFVMCSCSSPAVPMMRTRSKDRGSAQWVSGSGQYDPHHGQEHNVMDMAMDTTRPSGELL
jgi:hypothetical protein